MNRHDQATSARSMTTEVIAEFLLAKILGAVAAGSDAEEFLLPNASRDIAEELLSVPSAADLAAIAIDSNIKGKRKNLRCALADDVVARIDAHVFDLLFRQRQVRS